MPMAASDIERLIREAIPDAEVPQAVDPLFQHVLTTYASETNKTVSMWRAIPDDLLDYTADAADTGKPSGLDLREHKVTLPLIHALPRLARADRAEAEAFFRDPEPTDAMIRAMIELVAAHGGLDDLLERKIEDRE